MPISAGGNVLIGVGPDGRLVREEIADITLCDIVSMLRRVEAIRVHDGNARVTIVLEAADSLSRARIVLEAKPYEFQGSSTTVMLQVEHTRLLLDRYHIGHIGVNQPVVGVRFENLDRKESLRSRDGERAAAVPAWQQRERRRHPRSPRVAHRWAKPQHRHLPSRQSCPPALAGRLFVSA